MDYALVVGAALGAICLYLMLPRERPGMVKIGGLVGVLTLGGFFIYLIRWAHGQQLAAHAPGVGVFFYVFAGIAIAAAVGVICHPKPVYAALYFVLLTLAIAGLFILLYAAFLATVLIIIYAGAILVTYVFVLMLASQDADKRQVAYDRNSAEPLMAVLVSFVLLGTVLQVMFYPGPHGFIDRRGRYDHADARLVAGMAAHSSYAPTTRPANGPAAGTNHVTAMQALGVNLYSRFSLSLELAGVLLTVALVGGVMIARKNVSPNEAAGTGALPAE